MSLQSAIAKNVQVRNAGVVKVMQRLKKKSPAIYDRFAPIFMSKNVQLGAETSSWLDFGKDIAELVVNVKASKELDASDRKALELELKKIQQTNTALEKQQKLQKQLNQAQTINASAGGESAFSAILSAFTRSPLTLAALALGGTLIFMRKKRR